VNVDDVKFYLMPMKRLGIDVNVCKFLQDQDYEKKNIPSLCILGGAKLLSVLN